MKKNIYLIACALMAIFYLSSCNPSCVTSGFTPSTNAVEACGPVELSWPADPDAIDYDVYFDAGTTATTLVSQYQSGTTYTTPSLGPGTYTWKIIPNGLLGSASGCSSFTFTIPPAANPTATITANVPDTICLGSPIIFNSVITDGGSSPAYQWVKNGVNVGSNSSSYTINNFAKNDTVWLVMTSSISGGCNSTTVATSNKLILNSVIITPTPVTASTQSDTVSCNGGTATLTTTATGNLQWQVNGADWPGATQPTHTTSVSGDWTVKLSTPTGRCPSISNAIHLNLNAAPNPLLTVTGQTIATTVTYRTYQWYRNGVLIPGATNGTYTYTRDGFYKVAVTDFNNCSGTSSSFPVNTLAIGTTVNTDQLAIFPNPTTGMITVNTTALLNMVIQNLEGKVVMEKQRTNAIDITQLANGVYFIKLLDKNNNVLKTEKILKQ